MDTKKFTVTIDLQSNKNQNGIVRIFLGPRINNKQQLNEIRKNFVELDQFIVKLNQGQNVIKRNSVDFKNVVGEPETMQTLYKRALNTQNGNGKTNGNDMNNLNFDTNNNNRGFPHRLLLPKGTVGGEDYTLFVVVSDIIDTNNMNFNYNDNLSVRNANNGNTGSNSGSDSNSNESNNSGKSNSGSNSDSGSDSNESNNWNKGNKSNGKNGNNRDNKNGNNRNGDYNNFRHGNNLNNGNTNGNTNGNFVKTNGVMIHNMNNMNKNIGNGNGVLDKRTMGFPLDRQIIDVNGFITSNMFFKQVTVFHVDTNNLNNNWNYINNNGQN
jgi:Hemocyanin, ig-like domain